MAFKPSFNIVCDAPGCGETLTVFAWDKKDAGHKAVEKGWGVSMRSDISAPPHWVHYCPDCIRSFRGQGK